MWVEKYRPKNLASMVGNEDSRLRLLSWLKKWKRGGKPAFLIGPPGVGKTTAVYAVAKELGFGVIELNASDVRTKEKLVQKLGPSLTSGSVLDERLIIFLDEVDGLYGRQDHGGIEFVQELMEKSNLPVAMAANVEDDQKMVKLMAKSEVLRFKKVPPRLIELFVKRILRSEGEALADEDLREIVEKARGDVRAATNAAQAAVARLGVPGPLAGSKLDSRMSLREALNSFFEAEDRAEAVRALRECDALPRDKIRAFYSSFLRSKIDSDRLVKLLDALSKADELVQEIGTTQEWRLLRYFDGVLAQSIFDVMKRGEVKYGEDDLSWNLRLRIWNDSRALRELGAKLSRFYHISRRDAVNLYLPYFLVVLSRDRKMRDRVEGLLALDESVARVLVKEMAKVSEKVKS